MKTINFNEMRHGAGRMDAVKSGACLVEFKGSGSREVTDTCLLLNVTGLTEQSVLDLVSATTSVILNAKSE